MSHHVTCHVTVMSRASSSSLKIKIKRDSKKRNIKSRKIDKRERKMLVSKCFITTYICRRFELKAAKLTMVYEIVSNHIKLDSVTDDFFNEFSQCV